MAASERIDALHYHELTKHSFASVQSSAHYLDWQNQPRPYKVYIGLDPIPLPRELGRAAVPPGEITDLQGLARLLHYGGGVTGKKVFPDGQAHYFRAAACTGALYHIDLYVVCAALSDLDAGVYHFDPHDFALRRLRDGDHRGVLVDASGGEPATLQAPVALVCTSTFWRNAWKYQSRAYRHCFWDSGTIVANLLEVADVDAVAALVVVGFADQPVNQLLGLDTEREVALAWLALGTGAPPAPAAAPLPSIDYETAPLSRSEIDYPAIGAAHRGSALPTSREARDWRGRAVSRALPESTGALTPLASASRAAAPPIEAVITKRGSARRFAREAISYEAFSEILRAAGAAIASDFSAAAAPTDAGRATTLLNDLYLIVNAVDGLASGTYVYRPDVEAVELLAAGDFRGKAGYLDLGQELAADASLNCYVMSDLGAVVERFGNRGYRAAALEGGIIGGRLYLAAYRAGLAATGLTFFDDDVTDFFSPHAAGKGVTFLTAIGHRQRG